MKIGIEIRDYKNKVKASHVEDFQEGDELIIWLPQHQKKGKKDHAD